VKGVGADLVINVQGDEPLIPPRVIDALVKNMRESGSEMGTVAVTLDPKTAEFANPNIVKVVVDAAGRALYFSRATIPFQRADGEAMPALWHWGIYAYRREFLEQFVEWPPSPLEKCEKLEQLRALEHGARIQVLTETESWSIGVDVPEDIAKVEKLLAKLDGK
jgi:3-deoxy-manno-octulosonate cytidylyltransferase (CMP-KDO synthetase)